MNESVPTDDVGLASLDSITELWDAVIIGAGPAGGMTAVRLAAKGYKVLLVEAKRFPRDKVCGGCLNRRAWSVLQSAGLDKTLERAGAIELSRLQLTCGGQTVDWSMPTMHAISRATLDQLIVEAAVARGAHFCMETYARVEPSASPGHFSFASVSQPTTDCVATDLASDLVSVQLKTRLGNHAKVRAKVVIAADGLTHPSLGEVKQVSSRVASGSRVGLGTNLLYGGSGYPTGRLTMVVGRSGYVGVTRIEGERLNLAAALSPQSLQQGAEPGAVIARMLGDAKLEVPTGCESATWVGTPQLTRESQQCAARRIFLVGDATGYVEPFTGEGMSWALVGAVEVSQLAEQAILHWSDALAASWQRTWRTRVKQHQATCRGLSWLLKRPRLSRVALSAATYTPWLTSMIMQRVAGTALREAMLRQVVAIDDAHRVQQRTVA